MKVAPGFVYWFKDSGLQKSTVTRKVLRGSKESLPFWIHVTDPNEAVFQLLRKNKDIPNSIIESLLAEETRPRSVVVENGLMLILRGVNLNLGASPSDMVSLRIWITEKGMITISPREVRAVLDTENDLKTTPIATPLDCLMNLIWYIFSHIEDETYELEGLLDKLEAEIDTSSVAEAQKIVVDIRQQVISFRRYLMPQRDAILRLPAEKLSWLPQKQSMEFKDYGDNMSRYVEDLYAARERAGVLQDKLYNRLSETLNTKMYVLSIIALIFLPAGFITGLFGMNIIIPGANNVDTFWVLISIIASMTVGLYFYFRRKQWL